MVPADPAWLVGLPKAEVHVHLEGCIPADAIGLRPGDAEFNDLAGFLAYLDRSCRLVTEPEQLEVLAESVVARAFASGVCHVDAIINPSHWPAWRGRLDEMAAALDRGFGRGEADHPVTVAMSLSLLRTSTEVDWDELVDWLVTRHPPRFIALSADGNEVAAGRTGPALAPYYRRARQAGFRTCAHAGESSGPDGVRDALEVLEAERIDHGVRSVEDPALVRELADRATPLDICPTSNVRLGVVASLAAHPIEALRRAGVAVTVNTDDPLIFGCDVAGEYSRCAEAFGWDRQTAADIARTSIRACFAPEDRRRELEADLEAYLIS